MAQLAECLKSKECREDLLRMFRKCKKYSLKKLKLLFETDKCLIIDSMNNLESFSKEV